MAKKITGLGVLLLLLIGFFGWRHFNQARPEVWVVPVSKGRVEATVANTRAGTVKACQRSRLTTSTGGVVDRLLVKEGDQVVKDQLLLELWNQDQRARVVYAENTYQARQHERQQACLLAQFNRREADRMQKLFVRDLTSRESVDSAVTLAESQEQACAVARYQEGVAAAELQLQSALLARTRLQAPFDGVVAEINGEVGEYITPSPPGVPTPPAIDLIDYSCLYVTAPIDEIDASQVRTGLPVEVTLDAFRGIALQGEVVRIAPYVTAVEKQARTVEVEVRLTALPEQVALLVGYSADITVLLSRREQVLRIPTEALLSDDQVWIMDAETREISLRRVTTGIGNWTYTEVLAGLVENDLIVRSPDTSGLREGVKVEPVYD